MSEAAAPTTPQLLLMHSAPRGSGLGIADLSTDPMRLFGTLEPTSMPVWQGACSTIPGRAIEAAAIPQVHDIHQRAISGSFPGARTNCCGCRFMRKRLDAYRVDHPVVRGQRHDQATFGAQLRFADSPGKGHRVSYHPSLRAASVAIAGRQNAASLPAHLVLHAIELNGCAAGEGLLSTLQGRWLTA